MGFSLTIMLVMYMMYQSILGTVLKTAYLKLIDIWLIFCLSIPFVVFMIQISRKLTRTTQVLDDLDIQQKQGWTNNSLKEKTEISKSLFEKVLSFTIPSLTIIFVMSYFIWVFCLMPNYY